MSAWTDRIQQEFPADLCRFWVACDPDGLLLDERILHGLRERSFEVLPFEDPVAFRTEYEERYRSAWDRGKDGTQKALILQLRGTDLNTLSWDYLRDSRKVSLSLADLFPKLSYGVIQHIEQEQHEALFEAHNKHATQPLGERDTKDFILKHIFRISPDLLSRSEDFWRELLRLHYSGNCLPLMLADHVSNILSDNEDLKCLPVSELLSSKSFALHVLQDSWDQFLAQHGVYSMRSTDKQQGDIHSFQIPFDHPEVRVIVDNMFLDGYLQPVEFFGSASNLPSWASVGLKPDTSSQGDMVVKSANRAMAQVPGMNSTHREWSDFAQLLGEVMYRFHSLTAQQADIVKAQVQSMQSVANTRLQEWVLDHFSDLPSLPVAKAPVMVHHIPRYLAMKRSSGEERIALLVFDGLAVDQWLQLREYLNDSCPSLVVEDYACFAWLPTLTSVSRQAIFSGMKPREFQETIETTSKEKALWERFWQDNGLRNHEVFYQKGVKRSEQLNELAEVLSKPSTKVAGIIVDMIDEFVHGAMLGKRGIVSQIKSWCETGFVSRLFQLLVDNGYQIYLTSDHGNIDANGVGRINQGEISELKGQRVRVYRSEALLDSVPEKHKVLQLPNLGLPSNFMPLYAEGTGAFVSEGDQIVAHGGSSVEEMIVPFVKITMKSPSV